MQNLPGWRPLTVCDVVTKPCGYDELVGELLPNAIQNLVLVSTLVVVGILVFAGFILLKSQGDSGAMTKVKEMLWKVVIGYLWIMAAWLIVYSITSALLRSPADYSLLGAPK